ncbi:F0F1 ATP synthase subunit delta [Nocardioides sp. TRM66260-LWL]|uniref:F0F1 ATP synthase subunit delta n=1 Tax=Nocardioides sp. TRM66260-LWL TaxID=2874478 RepID=UPI001CC4FF33|nr:F0F1 ATP synthase subunit delta [Nocardioides sp. TRM66260-LWL]MBZ5734256.1 F0F1 ATP synthase subunit delta [Nocardioides sp. TRM66260-LWL]
MARGFRGGSADAVAALDQALAGAVSGSQETAAVVGRELFDVAETLRAEGALRRFLTDGSIASEAKSGLVREVLGPRLRSETLELVATAVIKRWTSTRDLADALEHLSVVASVRSAGAESGRLADELFSFGEAVKHAPELRDALADPARTTAAKASLIEDLLGGKALPSTVALAVRAVASSHRTVAVALHEFQRVASEVHGESVATVRVARPLSDADRTRLADALARQYGRPVHLNLLVDPSVIGGIRVEIGDDVIDGTVSSRLDEATRRLAG